MRQAIYHPKLRNILLDWANVHHSYAGLPFEWFNKLIIDLNNDDLIEEMTKLIPATPEEVPIKGLLLKNQRE